MRVEFNVYREEDRWFVQDENGFSKQENELIAGVPELLESIVGKARLARVIVSTEPFERYQKHLVFEDADADGGVTYSIVGDSQACWLCAVYHYYFPVTAPELFVFIEKLK
jgi:hypothetical protein